MIGTQKSNFVLPKKSLRTIRVNSHSHDFYTKKQTKIQPHDIDEAVKTALASNISFDEDARASHWDVVHELIMHYYKQQKRIAEEKKHFDALEKYCESDYSADECRIYDV
jgi:tRNA G37 N-methylase Trm5